jgi:adenine-specific DNA-methyltransferase
MSDKLQRLELVWPGKNERVDVEPRILIEDAEKSYSADPKIQEKINRQLFKQEPEIAPTFDNMLIHGDNLLALKALEAEYSGKVKCIYIDPPYNTGNAFEHYDDGYEHSIWLSLMRDRLEILKNLLADDGSIWISLDDNEQAYCKVLCDEIFGRKNFVCNVIWQKKFSPQNDAKWLSDNHDFIIVYAKNKEIWRPNLLPRSLDMDARYKNLDDDPRGAWTSGDMLRKDVQKSGLYSVTAPDGTVYNPPSGRSWRFPEYKYKELLADNKIWFGAKGNGVPRIKRFLSDVKQGVTALTIWLHEEVGHNQDAQKEVRKFNSIDVFATPKPEKLIHRILTLATKPGDLVLDSFLGSGTTAAVAHKMGRRWIGIEMGDHIYSHCLPRLKKVIDCEDAGGITKSVKWQGGGGFKFYELGSTLIITDKHGRQVISDKYNPEMLAEAMCKLMGYKYAPDKESYWKQGYSSEKNFIFTTTMNVEEQLLAEMSQALGDGNLLICCGAFTGNKTAYDNITIKKIPQAILKKCQWGSAGYPLPVREDFSDEDFEFEDEE